MQNEKKLPVAPMERSDVSETGRVMDSIDRVNSGVLGTQRILSEKHYDADINMEQEENAGIWNDSSLSTEEKMRLSQENHAFHNGQRIRAQQETMPVVTEAAAKMNAVTGKIATALKIIGWGCLGSAAGYVAGDLLDLAEEEKKIVALASGTAGASIAGALALADKAETASANNFNPQSH